MRAPRILEALQGVAVTSVACGARASAAISSAGALYVWGAPLGLLAHKHAARVRPVSVPLPPDEAAASVALGAAHGALVTSQAKLYTWGHSAHGALGPGALHSEVRALNGSHELHSCTGAALGDDAGPSRTRGGVRRRPHTYSHGYGPLRNWRAMARSPRWQRRHAPLLQSHCDLSIFA